MVYGKCGDCEFFIYCYREAVEQELNEDHEICEKYKPYDLLVPRYVLESEKFGKKVSAARAVESDVEHPSRYMHGNVECFDMLEATLSPREVIGFYKGCILKYVWREQDKGGYKDLQKAEMYARRLNEFCARIGVPGGALHDASRESANDTD